MGPGGPSGPGGNPAFLFNRPNVDATNVGGAQSNLFGTYTFTDNPNDANFWNESAIPDNQDVPTANPFFASDVNGDFHDLAGPNFFGGFDVQGQWELIITDANTGLAQNNDGSVIGWTVEFHVQNIPEPSSSAIAALAVFCLAGRRRRS